MVMTLGQAQIPCPAARWRAAAANLSCVVSSSRCIIGTRGGPGTARTRYPTVPGGATCSGFQVAVPLTAQ